MRKTKGLRCLVAFAGVCCALGASSAASAYNRPTHQRIVEAAVEAMVDAPNSPRPGPVDEAAWREFGLRLGNATAKLKKLRTGLFPVPLHSAFPDSRHSTFPGNSDPSIRVDTYNDPARCNYHDPLSGRLELNLLRARTIRIEDFPYYPNVTWTPCAYGPLPSRLGQALGPVLGWHGMDVDNFLGDSVLWFRPTNAAVFGLQKEIANRAIEFALGAVLLPFVCLGELIFSGSCNADDAFDMAREANPITLIEGLIPGLGSHEAEDYVGVWHFIDVDASVNRYNDVRGMFYEHAGPSHPGAVDVAIMAGADLSGLSLNGFDSGGPDHYGRHDRVPRVASQWQAHTIGHTEFSPIDNLAYEGWLAYRMNSDNAAHLAQPLHAVGDAAEPHHVTGTTSWGHRPFEDAVEKLGTDLLPLKETQPDPFPAFRDRVLRVAFDALRSFDGDPSIQSFIEREARATREIAHADLDWVFKDGPSVEYLTDKGASMREYEDPVNFRRAQAFLELGVGYTIALLARAGELARDPGPDPETYCPPNAHFTGTGTGCAAGPPPPPPPTELPPGIREVSCAQAGESCQQTTECCGLAECLGGRCTPPQNHCPADLVVDGTTVRNGINPSTTDSVAGDSCPTTFWAQITQPQNIFVRGGANITATISVADSECTREHTLFIERQRADGTFVTEAPVSAVGRLECNPTFGCNCVGLPVRTLVSSDVGADTSSIWVGTASHPQVTMHLSFGFGGGPG